MISCSKNKTFKIWDIDFDDFKKCTEKYASPIVHNDGISCIGYSEHDPLNKDCDLPTVLATGSQDYTTKLWNLESKELLYTFKGHSMRVKSV